MSSMGGKKPLTFIKIPSRIFNFCLHLFLGGVALVYVSQPLDTVKVKMQTFPTVYKGMRECLLETLRKDGFVRGW